MLTLLEGREQDEAVTHAARLLATVLGQELTDGEDGVFRIARGVASDRIISTVDPQARHGHKTNAHSFDGYKGHIAIDPDTEIITATEVTPGNSGDAEVAERLLTDMLPSEAEAGAVDQAAVYGDAAYGAGELLARLDNACIHNGLKVQPPARVKGHFPRTASILIWMPGTVTCPAGITATFRPVNSKRHSGIAEFGGACGTCPLAAQCTTATAGRTITIGHYEAQLTAGRARQTDPVWKADYRATRPKVERKIGHLMRRRHGGRRARVRGLRNVTADFSLLAAAVNLARLAALGIAHTAGGWTTAAA